MKTTSLQGCSRRITWVVGLNFEEAVGGDDITFIFSFVLSYKSWATNSFHWLFIKAKNSARFCMFQTDHFTRENELWGLFLRFHLPIIDHLPSVKVLRHVAFELFINLVGINSPLGWWWPVLWLLELSNDLVAEVFLADVKIWVVLGVVKQDMIIVNHVFSVLTVPVSGMHIVSHSLSWWVRHKL